MSVIAVWSRKTASNLLVYLENYVFVFVTKPASVSVIYFRHFLKGDKIE